MNHPTGTYPASWYAATAHPAPERPPLQGEQQVDVGILGAGFTGLSTALELARAGYRVAVLDAERIGWGASGRNGGQVIFGWGCGESRLEGLLGEADARRMFDWSLEGVRLLRERIAEHAIDCDWRDGHAHVAIKPRHITELKSWQAQLAERYDYPLAWWDRERLRAELDSPRYIGALFDPGSGHLHPLNYALGLARAAEAAGVQIFERSPVIRLDRGAQPILHSRSGALRCRFVVLAGNALIEGIAPELHDKIMPVGTYVGATAPLGAETARRLIGNDMAVADINWALDYFRCSADHRLLFGGRASYSNLTPPNLRTVMRARMRRVFPTLADTDFEYLWGGVIDISRNRAPHWGRLTNTIYFAQGFSGHGVAASGLAGRILAEAIRGQNERLDVFARIRHRDFPGGRALRTPILVAAMAWFKLRDALW
ncbi:MAG TPA: FAD-dependent oxidoreductase [Xanthomonadales bacterium]|nr:FAD-dependent oxidoreductase [Xanthomonadales bacterium]